jgi:glutaredoxin
MARTATTKNKIYAEDVEKSELWYIAGGNIKQYSHFGKESGSAPNVTSNSTHRYGHRKIKAHVYTKTCIWMFTAALFISAQMGKIQMVTT